ISAQVASFRLNILPSRKPNIEQLRQHSVDVAFSPFAPDHNDIMSVRLFDDVARCYYDPAYRSPPVTEQDFDNARYVGLSFTKGASASQTDKHIIQAIDANTVIRTNSFATMATFVKGSELMAIVPSKLNTLGFEHLDSVALPYQPTPITMRMLWHKKYQKNPKHQWFREQVVASTDIFRTY
ncbi:LysR substrate-binding domain-containing protein, partial [Marinobacter sp. 1Y8]